MKSPILYLLLLCFVPGCSAIKQGAPTKNELRAIDIKPVGRYWINGDGNLALVSSAAHFGYTFKGDSSIVYVSLPQAGTHNYLQYEVDGVYKHRVRINADSTAYITIPASHNGNHSVYIYKTTEAHTGDINISRIVGEDVKPIEPLKKPIIEFIGNSITCGAAADASEVPCGTGQYHDQHNSYFAYGPRVARALNVDFIISGVSGIGIYRTWNADGPAMPAVYENTGFKIDGDRLWNFDKYKPAIVSIALGTNDFSMGDGKKARELFDSSIFIKEYVKFVATIKGKYPDAQIALLTSPMVNGENDKLFRQCITEIRKQIDNAFPRSKPVAYFSLMPIHSRGCTGHPSVEDHAVMAASLTLFFKSLL